MESYFRWHKKKKKKLIFRWFKLFYNYCQSACLIKYQLIQVKNQVVNPTSHGLRCKKQNPWVLIKYYHRDPTFWGIKHHSEMSILSSADLDWKFWDVELYTLPVEPLSNKTHLYLPEVLWKRRLIIRFELEWCLMRELFHIILMSGLLSLILEI